MALLLRTSREQYPYAGCAVLFSLNRPLLRVWELKLRAISRLRCVSKIKTACW
jgi:hypothetical protein